MPLPRIGVVIVTMGTRPRELDALLASVGKQGVPAARVVLVGNATPLTDVTTDATKIPLDENPGCPGGRNVGLELLRASDDVDVVVELDDDGLLIADDVFYEPELVLRHPRTSPARHAAHYRFTARNRVWLTRRRLPVLLIPVHLGVWVFLSMARMRSLSGARAWWGGFAEGARTPCGPRKPMKWRTVWRMTRLGRPPIL
ncbi:glycosyltransferase family 2 protein [Streptomyces sp. NPDC059389]|uniref:glycosyltransferase family 2 protein n=1 Tax=Streptomyces sp. NPDC059389 TaxID=3346818 RepID=UPI0036B89D88